MSKNIKEGEAVKAILNVISSLKPEDINEENIDDIMNALPVEHRELLLTGFFNGPFVVAE